jgi:hypothetical protein
VNIDDFRRRMWKDAAPQRRRDLNIRVDKRPGLPMPAGRIQPQADKHRVITELGKLLAWRTGWHGLEAASGKRLFFVVRHLSETYVLDLEGCRVPDGPWPWPYHIKGDYKITDSMTPLGEFELLFTDDAVSVVYSFQVEGSGPLAATGAMAATGAGGVFLRPVMAKVITTPTKYRVSKAEEEEAEDSCEDLGVSKAEEEEAEDSCEDLGLTHLEASDLDEGDPAVDTGAESSDLSGKTTGSDPDSSGSEAPLKKVPATGDTVPATGGKPDKPVKCGKSGPIIWSNGFFFIKGNELDLKMHIHDRWKVDPPVGIGRSHQMTKTVTPSTVGEKRADPVRSFLVLKAWMLWRARIHPRWIERRRR